MSTSELQATTGTTPHPHEEVRLAKVFESRRASIAFAAIVLVATLVQVMGDPLVIIIQGVEQWTQSPPLPVMITVITAACIVQALSLLVSTRWPVLTVFTCLGSYLALVVLLNVPGWLTGMQLVVAISFFLLATHRTIGATLGWLALATAIYFATFWAWVVSIGSEPGVVVAFLTGQIGAFLAPTVGATGLGIWWGIQSRRVRRAQHDAEAASREHEERLAHAKNVERARIAQELHDVAGQHLSGLITLADAAVAFGPERGEDVVQLLEDVRAEGRFAAASLYGALADLRAVGSEPVEVTRDLRRATDLAEYWRRRGMAIDLNVSGDVDDLPAVVSTTAYRAVQEGLTNASKHAPGARVTVHIEVSEEWLHVSVENGRRHGRPELEDPIGLGWGLEGLRDRVLLIDGSVIAAPTEDGGWRLGVRIPLAEFAHGAS